MRRARRAVAVGVALAALGGCGGGEPAAPAIEVESAWARATAPADGAPDAPPPSAPGVLYLTLRNDGDAADRLVAVRGDAFAEAELHVTTTAAGVARMEPVAGVELPPGATVAMAPGGTHVMLFGLTRHLRVGDELAVTLELERSGPRDARVEVRAP